MFGEWTVMERAGSGMETTKRLKFKRFHFDGALFMAWAIPVGIMLLLFLVNGIFPFGDRSFLFSDMYHQYMPFFSEFVDKVRSGESLYYSWEIGVGSNFLALYVYYLASPLNWLAFLFPTKYLMEFMSYLVVVRIGFSGCSFCYYLRKHFETKSVATVLFSVFYALSGYMAAYNWNIMWLDCVVLLPLILLGLERLVKDGKPVLYCTMLTLSIVSNFYISIMICIFLVFYFFMLLLSQEKYRKPIGQFVVYSLLAGGMAACLLFPMVCAISVTDFGAMDFPTKITSYFPILDELARHQLSVTTERGLEHWPNIYCGVAILLLVPLFATEERISVKRRFSMLGLAGIMLLSFSTNVLDYLWHGMNYPNSLPARQSFIYIFLVLVMSYEAFLHIQSVEKKRLVRVFLLAMGFLLFCEKFVDYEEFVVGVEILSMVFVVIYAVLFYYYRHHTERDWRIALGIVAFMVVMVEAGLNTYNTSLGTVDRANYLEALGDYECLYELAQRRTDGFFRVEKFHRTTKNDGALAGYPTASVFSSTLNSDVANFYEKFGMRHSKVYYCFDGATPLMTSLLNVHYMFGNTEEAIQNEACLLPERLYTPVLESGDITLYEYHYALPFGYVWPLESDGLLGQSETKDPLMSQNEIAYALGCREPLFTRVEAERIGEDIVLTAREDAYYYMVVTSTGTQKINAEGSFGTKLYKDLKKDGVLAIGFLNRGQTVKLENADDTDDSPTIHLAGYEMNMEVLEQVTDLLSEQHMEEVVYNSKRVEGHITMTTPGKVVLTIPYEAGWQVYVNGEKTETGLLGDCFMTVALESGEYDIVMEYDPKGREEGLLLSGVSLVLFAMILLFGKRRKQTDIISE